MRDTTLCPADETWLRDNYATASWNDRTLRLSRSKSTIFKMAVRLGLERETVTKRREKQQFSINKTKVIKVQTKTIERTPPVCAATVDHKRFPYEPKELEYRR